MNDKTSRTRGARKPVSFRLQRATIELLERQARESGQTQTALVERYVEEGLRTDGHPLVRFREGFGGRRPALIGTRLDVWQVVQMLRENESVEATAEYLRLPVEHVRACLRFYVDYQDEIDAWAARARALEDREEENWRRQQELLR